MIGEIRVVVNGSLPTRQTNGQAIDLMLPAGSRIEVVQSMTLGWTRFKVLSDTSPTQHWYSGTREALTELFEERTAPADREA